ncbi:MAG TPA: hypothetical protein VMU95_41255 [Trebonia sp.]|nr:hypothetical protein [Trebonia sp.]
MAWLSVRARGVVSIVVLVVVIGGGNLVWTSVNVGRANANQHEALVAAQASQRNAIKAAIAASNRQWCDSLDLLTSGKPPSKSQSGLMKLDSDFQRLERKFECDSPKP